MNMVEKPEFFQPKAEERARQCAACPFNKANICTRCACVINAKIWSFEESCPEGRWDAVEHDELVELINNEDENIGENN